MGGASGNLRDGKNCTELTPRRLIDKKLYVCRLQICSSVEVGRYGRIILSLMHEGARIIVRKLSIRIVLVPVKTYDKPTKVLYGSVRLEEAIEEAKHVARAHIREKPVEGLE